MRSEILAVIPARGGSKGVPGKNIRCVGGKPLIAYSIEQAQATPGITRTVVSTDDARIAAVARQWHAEVVERPLEISGDTASSESALLHTLDYLRDKESFDPELVVFLQATSPLRGIHDIQRAIDTLQSEAADSLFSSARLEGFTWRRSASGLTPLNYDPVKRPRRQDLTEEIVEENGSIYIFKPWVLRQFQSRLGGKIATYEMNRFDSLQIDVPADIETVEKALACRRADNDLSVLSAVNMLVLDFDGVMTDNRVLVTEAGEEAVWCNRGDGWGIARVKEAGVEVIVISTEANPVVAARCRKLGIEYRQNCADKLTPLQTAARERSLAQGQIAYVGNDVNDLACLQWVGVPIVVADAMPEARRLARLVTTRSGGAGAVREVADWIMDAKRNGGADADR